MSKALTLANVRAELSKLGISIRRTHAGDLRVNFTGAEEASAYYTDDYEDALGTGQAMAAAVSRVRQERELALARKVAEASRRAALMRFERLLEDSNAILRNVRFYDGARGFWFGTVRNVLSGEAIHRSNDPIGQARFVPPAVHAFQVRWITADVADLLRFDLNNPNATAWWSPRSR